LEEIKHTKERNEIGYPRKEETNMATGICFIGGFSISPSVRKKRKKNNMNFRPNYNSVA
jgi:hypothetical protein